MTGNIEWQSLPPMPADIERLAPYDRREVLIWDGIWVHSAAFLDGEWFGTTGNRPYFEDDGSPCRPTRLCLYPTHWMPLPEPPS